MSVYPSYTYYPRWQRAPEWTTDVVMIFAANQSVLHTVDKANKSDEVLAVLRPGLVEKGFQVETGKTKKDRLERPVLFGSNGVPERQYHIDAFHPEYHVAFEVEAGRSIDGNAIYRDIVQMSLLVDAEYAAVAVPLRYRRSASGKIRDSHVYEECRTILEAIYFGRRLNLPFAGFLLVGF